MSATPSWTLWLRWLKPVCGAQVGSVERMPRITGQVFIEAGDATEIDPASLPPDVRRRGGTA